MMMTVTQAVAFTSTQIAAMNTAFRSIRAGQLNAYHCWTWMATASRPCPPPTVSTSTSTQLGTPAKTG